MQGPYQANLHPLSFPGIGEDAAHLLVERQIAGVGIDTGTPRVCSRVSTADKPFRLGYYIFAQ